MSAPTNSWSDPPSTRFGPVTQKDQPHPSTPKNSAESGSPQSFRWALPVEVLPTQKSKSEANKEQNTELQHSMNEWWATRATQANAILTFCLFVVACVQARLFYVQLRYIRRDLDDRTERESPFLHPVIDSAAVDAAFSYLKRYDHPTSPATPALPEASFAIRNLGRSPALLRSVAVDFAHLTKMVEQPGVDMLAIHNVEPIIDAGETTKRPFTKILTTVVDKTAFASIKSGNSHMFLYGEIVFSDVIGLTYTQKFCFAFDWETKSFVRWSAKYNERTQK